MNHLSDFAASLIRTYIPILVAMLVNVLAQNGVILDASASDGLVAFLSGLAGAVWYLVARLLERRANSKFGLLLGVAKQPEYVKPLAPIEHNTLPEDLDGRTH